MIRGLLTSFLDCTYLQNAATHRDANPKSAVTVTWTAPVDFVGDIIFRLLHTLPSVCILRLEFCLKLTEHIIHEFRYKNTKVYVTTDFDFYIF